VPTVRKTHWRRWVAAFAGIALILKTMAFALWKLFSVAKGEVQATGRDTDLVLRLVQIRKAHR
jgi:hypothetical protein